MTYNNIRIILSTISTYLLILQSFYYYCYYIIIRRIYHMCTYYYYEYWTVTNSRGGGVPLLRMCLVRLPVWPEQPLYYYYYHYLSAPSHIFSMYIYINILCRYHYMLLFSDNSLARAYNVRYILCLYIRSTKLKIKLNTFLENDFQFELNWFVIRIY